MSSPDSPVLDALAAHRLVPVVVVDGADEGARLADALVAGGLPVAEITLRLAGGVDAIRAVAKNHPDVVVGAGTVTTAEQVDDVVAAGARYIVSPGLSAAVVRRAQEHGVPVLPGVATPSEIMAALDLGIDVVKLFPAAVVGGPAAIKAFSAPFPGVRFVPTGGVSGANLGDYLGLQPVLAVGGSWMVERSLVTAGDWAEITRRTSEAVALARTIDEENAR
ncbi:bifunctional 4-hydroxy-2-oxoglutarate aldolase/2-dehydro-3-deoxy-phosphogluconate aldolase [Promicromonospora thailandica]|uniref:2-dehydro-3-deoxy-phosphogluconate aldolase n=1 Tax=Promicromonospora thailandica TaxID=765201 RepID=A0A9X2G196_9MICO|nr:bifunctional 4-hydroxy-2-oxoglutarate aldolase/2-dehydro-3-deoxy-phosphogluconate aldolase [Promicromonospora thailandica]MCP2263548.1 2-dehydro-3-deoxyphosphogluconate aldolase / (4S)-4-hydroxy-2-oxoglutarate aldolase [Promicromonospora thailandica]BFF19268.1 bifunctional 4-hydroxy-2-oxoglutarate aldolase/2-dehydro-3-deoxy-phosphogluconate aldolase [Promicromonospora thailandica]